MPGARNIPLAEVSQAMSDGRLPMEDPSRRIAVFGEDGAQARGVADVLASRGALINVAYFDGSPATILALAPSIRAQGAPSGRCMRAGDRRPPAVGPTV